MRMTLTAFAGRHTPQMPKKRPETEDQLRKLTLEDGVVCLAHAPFPDLLPGRRGTLDGKYLWVITPSEVPVILETAPHARPPPLQSGVAKHTNLTGGAPACCGGELWVDPVFSECLYVNGGSGRYQPRSPEELEDAVGVFEGLGFRVICAGWSEDNDAPERTFREP
ncbi:MAG: hypothetical protein JNL82_28365 [Myxococcales bacterium]|nr:hypothetical protein [Myxococcales bacterium]